MIYYKFNQTGVNQALLSYNRCMAKRSLWTAVLPDLFWVPSQNKKKPSAFTEKGLNEPPLNIVM